jgi:hypothetical protein
MTTNSSSLILVGHWRHSHEEDVGDQQIYRRESYDFPPSRGRTEFRLQSDGSACLGAIRPSDGLEQRDCCWRLESDKALVIEEHGRAVLRAELIECQPDRLKLKVGDRV